MSKKLPLSFYRRDTKQVAMELLGKRLVHVVRGQRISGIIVETEAYLGATDPACHTFEHRRSPRTESMYLDGGNSYVYFIYGMYYCFNVVTRGRQHPEAVLIRALQPDEGIETMQALRCKDQLHQLASGPGKLCIALGIDKNCDGLPLRGDTLFIEDTSHKLSTKDIVKKKRIGIAYAKHAQDWLLRFYWRNNPNISKK